MQLAEARAAKNRQLDIFEQRDHEFLERCRTLARMVCRERGQVSINDIRAIRKISVAIWIDRIFDGQDNAVGRSGSFLVQSSVSENLGVRSNR